MIHAFDDGILKGPAPCIPEVVPYIYVYIYMYTYLYTHMHTHSPNPYYAAPTHMTPGLRFTYIA